MMGGWKTWAAALLLILPGLSAVLTGAAGLLAHFVDPTSSIALMPDAALLMIQGGFATIGIGLAAVGLGHKIEKSTEAVTEAVKLPEKEKIADRKEEVAADKREAKDAAAKEKEAAKE